MTLSVLVSHPNSLAVATASCFPGVGAVVPALSPDLGVAVSQAVGRQEMAQDMLARLEDGSDAVQAIETVLSVWGGRDTRQCAVLGTDGSGAHMTGPSVFDCAGALQAPRGLVCGNFLRSDAVLDAAAAPLRENFGDAIGVALSGLERGFAAGGDARGNLSSVLLFSGDFLHLGYPMTLDRHEVRIDWSPDPLSTLRCATNQRLSYLLLNEFLDGRKQVENVEEAEVIAEQMASHDPDGSAAVLVAHELVAMRLGHVERGRALAERIVERSGGPGANPRTVERLWKPLR